MSSIVKKTGPRFVPRNPQRRSVALSRETSKAPTDTEEPNLAGEPQDEVEAEKEDEKEDEEERPVFKTVSFSTQQHPSHESIQRRRLSSISSGLKAGILKRPSQDMEPFKINVPGTSAAAPAPAPVPVTKVYSPSVTKPNQDTGAAVPVPEEGRRMTRQQAKEIESRKMMEELDKDAFDAADALSSMKKPIVYTDAELEEQHKYYLNPKTKKLEKVALSKFARIGRDSKIITSIRSLHNVPSKSNPKLLEDFVIDDEQITLEELCKPTIPIGKVSENFERAQRGDELRKQKRMLNSKRRKVARVNKTPLVLEDDTLPEQISDVAKPEDGAAEQSASGLQLKIQDGQIQFDDESLFVNRHENRGTDGRERETDNPFQNLITSASYGKRTFTDRWTKEETLKFYECLRSWGTDFGLIAQFFPYRTRRQIKAKFNTEEKKNPELVEVALLQKLPLNVDKFITETKQEFKTLEEYESEISNLKLKHDQELEEMRLMRDKARQEDMEMQRRKEEEIRSGKRNMTRRDRIEQMRQNEEVIGTIEPKRPVV